MNCVNVGFAKVCITPPLGIEMAGYYHSRKAKGVRDDLYATAVAFEKDGVRTLVISTDLLYIIDVLSIKYRTQIAERLNLPLESILIMGTHIHTGPLFGKSAGTGAEEMPLYNEYLGHLLMDAAVMAMDDLKPARLSSAEGEAKGISFIRRFRMKDGSVRTNPGIGNPEIAAPLGEPYEGVILVKAEREGADDVYIVNFAVHPDVVHGDYFSADWPGVVRSTLEKTLDGVKCAFFNGFEGDVNHIDVSPKQGDWDVRDGYECAKHMGRVIAGAVLQICGRTRPVAVDRIAFGSKIIVLPSNQENDRLPEMRRICELHLAGRDDEITDKADMERVTVIAEATRIVMLENGPESYDFLISATRIGDLVFAGIPGEPFTEIGNRVRAASPFGTTILCCCTNGGSTYYPTSAAYDEGGYEARASKLRKGADNIIVEGMSELIASLK